MVVWMFVVLVAKVDDGPTVVDGGVELDELEVDVWLEVESVRELLGVAVALEDGPPLELAAWEEDAATLIDVLLLPAPEETAELAEVWAEELWVEEVEG